jgi:hypothetical protein
MSRLRGCLKTRPVQLTYLAKGQARPLSKKGLERTRHELGVEGGGAERKWVKICEVGTGFKRVLLFLSRVGGKVSHLLSLVLKQQQQQQEAATATEAAKQHAKEHLCNLNKLNPFLLKARISSSPLPPLPCEPWFGQPALTVSVWTKHSRMVADHVCHIRKS